MVSNANTLISQNWSCILIASDSSFAGLVTWCRENPTRVGNMTDIRP